MSYARDIDVADEDEQRKRFRARLVSGRSGRIALNNIYELDSEECYEIETDFRARPEIWTRAPVRRKHEREARTGR